MHVLSKLARLVLFITIFTGICHGQQTNVFGDLVLTDTEIQQLNLAEQGNAQAQYYVGWMYENVEGLSKSDFEAIKWYQKVAIKWYQKAADQGNDDAKKRLAAIAEEKIVNDRAHEAFLEKVARETEHKDVVEIEKSKEFVKWYGEQSPQMKALAQSADVRDIDLLLLKFKKETGYKSDPNLNAFRIDASAPDAKTPPAGLSNKAIQQWKLANQGDVGSQTYLGYAYVTGQGAPKDYAEALKWYQKAATQGDADAQYNLGVMSENGWGVTKDDNIAVQWYQISAAQGNADAQKRIDTLKSKANSDLLVGSIAIGLIVGIPLLVMFFRKKRNNDPLTAYSTSPPSPHIATTKRKYNNVASGLLTAVWAIIPCGVLVATGIMKQEYIVWVLGVCVVIGWGISKYSQHKETMPSPVQKSEPSKQVLPPEPLPGIPINITDQNAPALTVPITNPGTPDDSGVKSEYTEKENKKESPAIKYWYYVEDGTQVGPVSEQELINLITSDKLHEYEKLGPNVLVWTQELKEWTRACDVENLIPTHFNPPSIPAPPPVPSKTTPPPPPIPASEISYTTSVAEETQTRLERLYVAVIGDKNRNYYLAKFKRFDQQGTGLKASWNWPAFLCGVWPLYRKMYGWFFALWVVMFTSKIFDDAGMLWLGVLIPLISWVLFTVFADSLYHKRVKKKIAIAQFAIKDESKLEEFLKRNGGVNTWVVWVFCLIPVVGIILAIVIPALMKP